MWGGMRLTQLYALVIRIQQKGPEAIGHIVISQELQIVLTELKLHRELMMDLERANHVKSTSFFN